MKIGLVTYHSSYNFGSVLQAYATQSILQSLGHEVEIINYRMPSQKNFYSLFPVGISKRTYLKNVISIPTLNKRINRKNKYEKTFSKIFNLTEVFEDPQDANKYRVRYDVYVSGSDQIWNRYSNELFNVDWLKYMSPYLLDFTEKKRISFASSIASMKDEDLVLIKDALNKFEHISSREGISTVRLEKLLGRKIETVLDPTLLLNKDDWISFIKDWKNVYTNEKYILYYVLKGAIGINKDLIFLNNIAKDHGMKLITISPLSPIIPDKNIINAADAAVYDFIGLINGAECVVTDSYHGTLFSVNLQKKFFSLQIEKDLNMRVEQMAEKIGFKNRVIYSLNDINIYSEIDYKPINNNIDIYKKESIQYLKNSIEK